MIENNQINQTNNWDIISISYIHNLLILKNNNQKLPMFDSNVNSTTFSPRETNSYTSLINWSVLNNNNYGIIFYDMIKQNIKYTFGLQFTIDY